MDIKIQKAADSFIINLTSINTVEIREYVDEIRLNQKFHNSIEQNRDLFGRKQYSSWDFSIGSSLGMILYVICRSQKPDIIVETGVASGVSSSYILCALEQNNHGQLYSIDQPWWQDKQSGWIIPDYLRHRWHLIKGKSSAKLVPLLTNVGEIDIFLHDSEHTYKNMLWEFQTAWTYLKSGRLMLAHNIDTNDAFADFCRSRSIKGYLLNNMGGVVKA